MMMMICRYHIATCQVCKERDHLEDSATTCQVVTSISFSFSYSNFFSLHIVVDGSSSKVMVVVVVASMQSETKCKLKLLSVHLWLNLCTERLSKVTFQFRVKTRACTLHSSVCPANLFFTSSQVFDALSFSPFSLSCPLLFWATAAAFICWLLI